MLKISLCIFNKIIVCYVKYVDSDLKINKKVQHKCKAINVSVRKLLTTILFRMVYCRIWKISLQDRTNLLVIRWVTSREMEDMFTNSFNKCGLY